MSGIAEKALPIGEKLDQAANEIRKTSAEIEKAKMLVKKAENDPRASEEKIRKLKEAQEMLEKKKGISDLHYRRILNDGKTREIFGSMRDSCQDLAGNPAVGGTTLKQKCGMWFDANDPKSPELVNFGIPRVDLPAWRYVPGTLSPFPPGSVKPQTGQTSPVQPGVIQGPGVPPVHGGPLPGQGFDDEND